MIVKFLKMSAWVVFGGFFGFGVAWPIAWVVDHISPGSLREGAAILVLFPITILGCLLGVFL